MLPVAWALGGPGDGVAAAVEAAGKSGAAHSEAGRLPHKRTYPPRRQSFTRPSRNSFFFLITLVFRHSNNNDRFFPIPPIYGFGNLKNLNRRVTEPDWKLRILTVPICLLVQLEL